MTRNSRSIARGFNVSMEQIGRAIRPKSQSLRVLCGTGTFFVKRAFIVARVDEKRRLFVRVIFYLCNCALMSLTC